LFREPRIEVTLCYREKCTLADACKDLGLSADFAEFAACGLFPASQNLYEHQYEALKTVACDDQPMVVTTGTGSGKTECFLLPLFESLTRQAAQWPEKSRPRAMRALIMYPLNALAEDQMVRLRRSADSIDFPDLNIRGARDWWRANRNDLIRFGRYTGRTPIPGARKKQSALATDRQNLLDRAQAVRHDPELRYHFSSLDGGEAWNRWQMQDDAPDILVTNYSMLNIMLMRKIESPLFDQTRRWLAEDPDARFHLIVDELHTYRGAAGTEVVSSAAAYCAAGLKTR